MGPSPLPVKRVRAPHAARRHHARHHIVPTLCVVHGMDTGTIVPVPCPHRLAPRRRTVRAT
jgi:hypothetical protein